MIIDFSDFIAHLSVLIELLTALEPDGSWASEPLLLAYQRDHYCLSLKQAKQLERTLEVALERVTASKRYQQLDLLGGGDSA